MTSPFSVANDNARQAFYDAMKAHNAERDKPAMLGTKRSASEAPEADDDMLLDYELRSPFDFWGCLLVSMTIAIAGVIGISWLLLT